MEWGQRVFIVAAIVALFISCFTYLIMIFPMHVHPAAAFVIGWVEFIVLTVIFAITIAANRKR